MLVGPGGEDGAEDQVELDDGQVQVHRLELLCQAGVLHLEVPATERRWLAINTFKQISSRDTYFPGNPLKVRLRTKTG